jgi:transcriptional regulator GlxA family with amidase domain
MTDEKLTVGGVMYPGFEMLDMFGPLEMFSMLGSERVDISMAGETDVPVPTAVGPDIVSGPKVAPDVTFDAAPDFDVVLVPGGFGTLPQLENDAFLAFLRRQAASARIVASVCTGSVLLARAGLLDGRCATSNKQLFALAQNETAPVEWVESARWVEDGNVFTSSGVSAGMDMALAIVARLFDEATAEQAAVAAEYSWHRDADTDPFAAHLNELAGLLG